MTKDQAFERHFQLKPFHMIHFQGLLLFSIIVYYLLVLPILFVNSLLTFP